MKNLILPIALALAVLLPATASARPILDPPINTPAPAVQAPAPDHASVVGYVLVGLGGLALGAAGAVSVRRVLPA